MESIGNSQITGDMIRQKTVVARNINLTNLPDVFSNGLVTFNTTTTSVGYIRYKNPSYTPYTYIYANHSATVVNHMIDSYIDANNRVYISEDITSGSSGVLTLYAAGNSNVSAVTISGTTEKYVGFALGGTEIARFTSSTNGLKMLTAGSTVNSLVFYTANTPNIQIETNATSTAASCVINAHSNPANTNREAYVSVGCGSGSDASNTVQLVTTDSSGNASAVLTVMGGAGTYGGTITINANTIVGTSGKTIGFYGSSGAAKPTLNAASTDLATVVALTNQIRQILINWGLSS